jgi:glycosyltransferase involved in cell wall biosynthesis
MMIQLEVVWPLLLLAILVACALYYYYRFWLVVLRYKDRASAFNSEKKPVSVIVAARNEAQNLATFLPALLTQEYPDFEVIVVNDCSYDESADVLQSLQAQYTHLKVLTIEEQPKYPTGKKFALTLAIKAAKHEVLLFTDADCRPATKNWIQGMQQQYINKTELVLGYSSYQRAPGLLNALIRFDTVLTAMHYFGHALRNKAYMGVGRNLSYLRTLFFFHKGFVAHIKHHSGDDSLFVNAAATADNVRISLDPDTFILTTPKSSWMALFRQKSRHLSNSKYFKSIDKFWMGYVGVLHWFTAAAFLFTLWFYFDQSSYFWLSIGIFALGVLHRLTFLALLARRLQDTSLLVWLPLVLPVHQLFQLIWALQGYIGKPKW